MSEIKLDAKGEWEAQEILVKHDGVPLGYARELVALRRVAEAAIPVIALSDKWLNEELHTHDPKCPMCPLVERTRAALKDAGRLP